MPRLFYHNIWRIITAKCDTPVRHAQEQTKEVNSRIENKGRRDQHQASLWWCKEISWRHNAQMLLHYPMSLQRLLHVNSAFNKLKSAWLQFVKCTKNGFLCVCPQINCVITLSKWLWKSRAGYASDHLASNSDSEKKLHKAETRREKGKRPKAALLM